jgi:hypothetical protein
MYIHILSGKDNQKILFFYLVDNYKINKVIFNQISHLFKQTIKKRKIK